MPSRRSTDLGTEFLVLNARLLEQLAESCPSLSAEARCAFAAQLTSAALRQKRGEPIDLLLYEVCGRNN